MQVTYQFTGVDPRGFEYSYEFAGSFSLGGSQSAQSGQKVSGGPLGFVLTSATTWNYDLFITPFSSPGEKFPGGDTFTLDIPQNSIDITGANSGVPEPSTFVLMLGAAGALLIRRRRR